VGSQPDQQIGTVWQFMVDRYGSVGKAVYVVFKKFDYDAEWHDHNTGEVRERHPLYEAAIINYPLEHWVGHTCRLYLSGSDMYLPSTGSVKLERLF
jgi:hypothetical protein